MYPKSFFEGFWKLNANISMVLSMFMGGFFVALGSPQGSLGCFGEGLGSSRGVYGRARRGPDMKGSLPGGGSKAPPRSKMNVLGTHGVAVCAPDVTNTMVLTIFWKICVFVE